MDHQPLIVGVALALPIICALMFFILLRSERKPVHLMMAALIASIIPWLAGLALRTAARESVVREAGLDLEHVTTFWMPALFAVAMGYFARLRAFETNIAPAVAFLVSAPIFTALYFVPDLQGFYYLDRGAALAGGTPEDWAGPFYWATKAWALLLNGSALVFLGISVIRGRTVNERRRSTALLAAAGAPLLAHVAFVVGGNPLGETLTLLALLVTAFAVVYGAHRYGLLDGPPLIRNDVIDHLHEGLVITNEAGIVLDLNESAAAALQTKRSRAMGLTLAEFLEDSTGRERASEVAGLVVALSTTDEEIEREIIRTDGGVLELSAVALRSEGLVPGGRIVLLRDRSEQRRAETLLREHQKRESVGILAAGVAHEVNNPLAYVRSNLSHVQSMIEEATKVLPRQAQVGDWHELPDVLTDTLEGLDRIEAIVKNLVRFSGMPEEKFEPVEIAQVVEDALRLADLHHAGRVALSRREESVLPMIHGSSNRLVQAVLNLLLNANQALLDRPDPQVYIESRAEPGSVVLRIGDNGPGISEALRDRIFDPFFTTKGPDEGTGLGLSISFDIAREHGGTLELETTERGACFAIRLPIPLDPKAEGV